MQAQLTLLNVGATLSTPTACDSRLLLRSCGQHMLQYLCRRPRLPNVRRTCQNVRVSDMTARGRCIQL